MTRIVIPVPEIRIGTQHVLDTKLALLRVINSFPWSKDTAFSRVSYGVYLKMKAANVVTTEVSASYGDVIQMARIGSFDVTPEHANDVAKFNRELRHAMNTSITQDDDAYGPVAPWLLRIVADYITDTACLVCDLGRGLRGLSRGETAIAPPGIPGLCRFCAPLYRCVNCHDAVVEHAITVSGTKCLYDPTYLNVRSNAIRALIILREEAHRGQIVSPQYLVSSR